jgi:hypothetical protein
VVILNPPQFLKQKSNSMTSTVNIKVRERTQANLIAILIEDGKLQKFLNRYIDEKGLPVAHFHDASCESDNSIHSSYHRITID